MKKLLVTAVSGALALTLAPTAEAQAAGSCLVTRDSTTYYADSGARGALGRVNAGQGFDVVFGRWDGAYWEQGFLWGGDGRAVWINSNRLNCD
ncbi:hypothetical protein ABZX92_26155 [Lentzea sp. NPDC006480]|uniref:hypothetical protein n=1 Tax=Lentzea sp. NPDC006480 TaxID=3157176 RepID=UPI0033B2AA67